jgi:regulator of sigma E protease
MSYFLAFAGFCFLIVMHELGHFTAAKMVGMRVERFSLFFPPIIAKVKKGETEYGIGAIPLGGYVKITGMNSREDYPPEFADRAYHTQPVWKRIFVIAAGPAVNLVIALVILMAIYGTQGVPAVNPHPDPTAKVGSVVKGSPASGILKGGDTITTADGVSGSVEKIRDQIARHRCAGAQRNGCVAKTPVELVVVRHGKRIHVSAKPRYSDANKRMLLGFSYSQKPYYKNVSAPEAFTESVSRSWDVGTGTVSAVTKVFYDSKTRHEVHGTVGLYAATQESISFGTTQALLLLALVSLSLAIVNLFPFLPLDGGHIFWALAEKVRGRPISFDVIERVSVVGMVLIGFIVVVGLTNDVDTIRSGKDFIQK